MYLTNCLDSGNQAFFDCTQSSLPDAQCLLDARIRLPVLSPHQSQRYGAGIDVISASETWPADILKLALRFVLDSLAGTKNAQRRVVLGVGKRGLRQLGHHVRGRIGRCVALRIECGR